jgi:cation diffusion facilitator family transporter
MSEHRSVQAKKITFIGAAVNTLQGIIKVLGGLWFNSHALIADGFHSFSDLLTDLMVIFASHYGSQDPDETHPYGHQRIETATTLALSLLLIIAGFGIGWHAYDEWAHHVLEQPTYGALVIAALSICINEILFFITLKVGNKIRSELVKANAWHHRSDSASALVVCLGILGAMMGYPSLDAFAAMIVAVLIMKMGLEYAWNSVKELVDTAVPPEITRNIETVIASVPGVNKIHQLRTRSMGAHILVDVHILVSSYLSVSEGHYIAQHVHKVLMQSIPLIQDVTVHVDPEDDELYPPSVHLPNRTSLEKKWLIPLQQAFPIIQSWNLHYIGGQLIIDFYLTPTSEPLDELSNKCFNLFEHQPDIQTIRFYILSRELSFITSIKKA